MSWRVARVLVLLFYFTAMGIGLGATRALTRHEVFTAQPAREMLAGAGWLIQRFGGEPRYEKPPTMSWLIAGAQGVTGSASEWTARLPAVLAGAVVVLLVMSWTRRQYDDRTAIVAGLMQATFFYTVLQARLAEVDFVLLACVSAGMFALGHAFVGESRHRAVLGWAFALSAGLAALCKGPVGPAVMYLGALSLAAAMRSRALLWWTLHPGRLAVAVAVGGRGTPRRRSTTPGSCGSGRPRHSGSPVATPPRTTSRSTSTSGRCR